jgi:hypothetical protein
MTHNIYRLSYRQTHEQPLNLLKRESLDISAIHLLNDIARAQSALAFGHAISDEAFYL